MGMMKMPIETRPCTPMQAGPTPTKDSKIQRKLASEREPGIKNSGNPARNQGGLAGDTALRDAGSASVSAPADSPRPDSLQLAAPTAAEEVEVEAAEAAEVEEELSPPPNQLGIDTTEAAAAEEACRRGAWKPNNCC
mmetsp:Transcript_66119/g.138106  ORF Transcript_66119/g.138106 Transcript_66119/m.138106 type:complete len:137 (+) Transcript_66119:1149-1559(+)